MSRLCCSLQASWRKLNRFTTLFCFPCNGKLRFGGEVFGLHFNHIQKSVRMSGESVQNGSPSASGSPMQSVSASTPETKPKKKICCACPETKRLRDECIVEHGEEACAKWIEAHRTCLRAEGFNV